MLGKEIVWILEIVTGFIQWASSIIVLGITSYLIHNAPVNEHLVYQEVIVSGLHSIKCKGYWSHQNLGRCLDRFIRPSVDIPVHAHRFRYSGTGDKYNIILPVRNLLPSFPIAKSYKVQIVG